MVELVQRAASLGDLKGIWNLMRQVAAEVPFELESEAAQERVLSELMVCCASGLSSVALDEGETIVGAVLAKRDEFEWGFRNRDVVVVSYAAIAPSYRDQGVLRALVGEIQQRKVPVAARVKSDSKLGLAEGLTELGFAHEVVGANDSGDLYRWSPSSAN